MLRAFPRLSGRTIGLGVALVALATGVLGGGACVPTGSAPPWDAGVKPKATVRQAPNVLTAVFEDNFDRADTPADAPDAAAATVASGSTNPNEKPLALDASVTKDGGGLGLLPSKDAGLDAALRAVPSLDPSNLRREPPVPALAPQAGLGSLGPNWRQAQTTAWKIENGKLCGRGAKNHGVWLERPIPINARIEFDATTFSPEGDLKAEVWGDGQSAATSVSYTNATSYLTVFGGWKNSLHVLARINEHGTDRKEIRIDKDSDDTRQHPVALGQSYRFKIERNDGKTVRWSVNGVEYLKYEDAEPLVGIGHDHFGFNDWEAKVCFDNVRVTPL